MARLSRIEKIRRATAPKASPVVLSKMDDLASRICGGPIGPSQRAFIFSNERRLWFTGPVGVGKTEALIASIMCPAILYPRFAVVHRTPRVLDAGRDHAEEVLRCC
jgi:hypothetical protein